MKKQDLILATILVLLIIPAVSAASDQGASQATIGTFSKGSCIDLVQTCSDCTYVNISKVTRPDSTTALGAVGMQKTGPYYNYTFCDTNMTGDYQVNGYGDSYGLETVWNYYFTITPTGNIMAKNGVVIFFSILFLVILLSSILIIVYSLGHLIKMDFDIVDLSWNYGIYFVLVATYMLHNNYLGDTSISNLLDWFIYIGAVTNLFLPTIYFILTLTVSSWQAKQVQGVDY